VKHRAQLGLALELADVEKKGSDTQSALIQIETLAREPIDLAVIDAKIARGFLVWKQGASAAARQAVETALADWYAHQTRSAPSSGIEADVAEIHRVILFPPRDAERRTLSTPLESLGGDLMFVILRPDVAVKQADGKTIRVRLHDSFGPAIKPLFATTEQIEVVRHIIRKLRGSSILYSTPPASAAQADSRGEVLALWYGLLPVRPRSSYRWDVLTYPLISQIEFTNSDRTRAVASITAGSSGHWLLLEKEQGRWVPRKVLAFWDT
jgi:hypothetical protein